MPFRFLHPLWRLLRELPILQALLEVAGTVPTCDHSLRRDPVPCVTIRVCCISQEAVPLRRDMTASGQLLGMGGRCTPYSGQFPHELQLMREEHVPMKMALAEGKQMGSLDWSDIL